MARETNNAPGGAEQEQAPAEFPLTLEEFCARLSATDKRVELISGFHHTEKAAGNGKDLESAYRARFQAFTTAEVK